MATEVGSEAATPGSVAQIADLVRQALLPGLAAACVAGATLGCPSLAARAAAAGLDGDARPVKAEPAKDFGPIPKGPLQIVVSITDQHVTLYSGGVLVAQGPVSTGVPGRPTPTGVFSIIQKDRFHRSNLYSNAPMPFMERITWSGVALHEGPLPGYPASHGCIRMTHDFAARLWVIARLGLRVIVAHNEVVPADIDHPLLFQPKAKPSEPPIASADPEKHVGVSAPVSFTETTIASPAVPGNGGAARKRVEDTIGAVSPTAGRDALPPVAMPVTKLDVADPAKSAADLEDPDKPVLPPVPAKPKAADQAVKHSGHVAVFISRKEKKLYVRQGFVPLFEVPVEIEHPEQPFGTHVFTGLGLIDNGTHMRWNVMSVPAEPARAPIAAKIGPSAKMPAAAVYPPQTAAQILDRIQIPQEVVDRVGEILAPGVSLVVSDQGLGLETGEDTDFIVLTR